MRIPEHASEYQPRLLHKLLDLLLVQVIKLLYKLRREPKFRLVAEIFLELLKHLGHHVREQNLSQHIVVRVLLVVH